MKVNGEICTIIGIIIVISSVSTYEKVSSERYIMISNTPPVASFNFSPFMPSPNESIAFNSTSYDIDGYITNYTWNFGDGSYAYGKNVSHFYMISGKYNVTLTIKDDDGAENFTTKSIVVSYTPIANFTFETDKNKATFNSTSYDIDGYITNYTWNFGDGSIAYGKNVSHEYDNEGIYNVCLIVMDNVGKNASICKNIVIDVTPPYTTYKIIPSSLNGKNGWYISWINIKLNAIDNMSGVKETRYKLDNGGWKKYNGAINITTEGNHMLSFYSIDNNGNVEDRTSIILRMDFTPPSTSYIINKNATNGWFNDDVNITLFSYDFTSGLDSIYYFIDNKLHRYNGKIRVGEGHHIIVYYGIDVAGNVEKPNKIEINVDKHAPNIEIVNPSDGIYLFGRKLLPYSHTIVLGNITISVYANDNLSGVSHVDFYIDGSFKFSDNKKPYSWRWDEKVMGLHEIKIVAYDKLGNKATIKKEVFIINLD